MIGIVKIFIPAVVAFLVGISITPAITNWLYRNKMWKKKAGKLDITGKEAVIFNELHKDKEINTPRMGGIVIWLSAFITISLIWIISKVFGGEVATKIDFLSRNQTWIPLTTLLFGALVGLIDDLLEIRASDKGFSKGMSLKKRLAIVGMIGLLVGSWFYFKLDVSTIGLPFGHALYVGMFIIPLFAIVMIAIYSGGVIDGIDGLAGGIFAIIFTAYAGIAYIHGQGQVNLAAFCAMIVGAILSFLWFNIPPARYYMSETGSMALTITLTVVAFMTDALGGGYGLIVLPIIAFPLIATSLSNIIQVTSKKMRNGKKVFRVAPIHHHFEAIGWPSYKVTMRYWVIGVIFAIVGMILALIG